MHISLGPKPPARRDIAQATASLKRLPTDVDRILSSHGGLIGPDAGARLRLPADEAQSS